MACLRRAARMRYRSAVFDAFQDQRPSWRPRVVAVLLLVVAAAIALIGYFRWRTSRDALSAVDDLVGAGEPAIPSLAPDSPVKIALPGMSIDAPSAATVTGDYLTGSVQAMSPIEWAVAWQAGPLPPPIALQSVVGTMMRTFETRLLSPARVTSSREISVGGAPGRLFEMVNERGFAFVVAFGECGGRVVQILSGGLGARETTTAMVDSFRCTPDASQDLDRDSVAVEVRPGWRRNAATGHALLVNARELVVRMAVLPGAQAGPLEPIVPSAIRAAGFTIDSDVGQERGGRKVWFGSLTLSGKPRRAAVVAWACGADMRIAAIYIVSMEGAPLEDGIALALTGRCLRPGEKAPEYPLKGAK
jgi:hypothetical protein